MLIQVLKKEEKGKNVFMYYIKQVILHRFYISFFWT